MNKLNGLVFAAALCAMAAPAVAQQAQVARPAAQYQRAPGQQLQVAQPPAQQQPAPEQAQPQTSVVAGARAWQPTGVTVIAGGQLQISATGQWSAVGRSNFAAANIPAQATDANGYPNSAGGEGTLLPSANRGALIGKIGENGAPFLIGASFSQTAPADGPLFLSMNDVANGFEDNSGRLAVSITAAAPLPPPVEEPPPPAPEATPTPEPSAPPLSAPNDQAGADAGVQQPSAPRGGPSGITNMIIIAVGALIALFIAAQIFRPAQRNPDRRQDVNVPQVSARIANSGIADQALTIRVRGR